MMRTSWQTLFGSTLPSVKWKLWDFSSLAHLVAVDRTRAIAAEKVDFAMANMSTRQFTRGALNSTTAQLQLDSNQEETRRLQLVIHMGPAKTYTTSFQQDLGYALSCILVQITTCTLVRAFWVSPPRQTRLMSCNIFLETY